MKDSQFEPGGFEVGFGSNDGLPPISIPNNSMNALLRGFIDRVDLWQSSGSSYYRVVDYKTGNPNLNLKNVQYGLDMQLPVYIYLIKNF